MRGLRLPGLGDANLPDLRKIEVDGEYAGFLQAVPLPDPGTRLRITIKYCPGLAFMKSPSVLGALRAAMVHSGLLEGPVAAEDCPSRILR